MRPAALALGRCRAARSRARATQGLLEWGPAATRAVFRRSAFLKPAWRP